MDNKSALTFLVAGLFFFLALGVVIYLWPSVIPFGFFEFWTIKKSLWEAVIVMWPLYAWGICSSIFSIVWLGRELTHSPGEILAEGTLISLRAGILEEIFFRWLLFFSAIIVLPVIDWIFFGFMGIHVFQWIYGVLCTIADFFSFGYLHGYLFHSWGWSVGAAIISSNIQFRDGHAYQGIFGLVNAWFGGMALFYVMFEYGIVAAISVHFLYNFFVFFTHTLNAVRQRI